MRIPSSIRTLLGFAAVATLVLISPGVRAVRADEPPDRKTASEGRAPAAAVTTPRPTEDAVCPIPDPEIQQVSFEHAMAQIRAQLEAAQAEAVGDAAIEVLNTRGHNYARDGRPPAPVRPAPRPAERR